MGAPIPHERGSFGDILGQRLPTIFVLNAICKRQHVAMRLLAAIAATISYHKSVACD